MIDLERRPGESNRHLPPCPVTPNSDEIMRLEPKIPNTADRRDFFRQTASRLVRPLASYLERHTTRDEPTSYLRPPGALSETHFADTCQRCGACVEACPAHAIFSLGEAYARSAGTPAVDPDRAACVVCDGLVCTTVCPSGALLPVTDAAKIRMGVAEVYDPLCVRTSGESCSICVDRCPIGDQAIRFIGSGPPKVSSPGCVGCGVCQLYCPTEPKAIVVHPTEPISCVARRS